MTSQDHMWKLPLKKTSFTTLTTSGVHAATSRLARVKLHSQIWVAICFSPGFPGRSFPSKWQRCGPWPHQRVCEVVTPPAPTRTTQQRGLLSFISQLVETAHLNTCDGLVLFKGGSKSLSALKTAVRETYTGRRISPSYQLQSIFGLLKDCYNSYFHTYVKVPAPS